MHQLTQMKTCFACGDRFDCLKVGRHIVTGTRVIYFCPKHKSRNFHGLEKALRKYHDADEQGLPKVPLDISEYGLLIEAGVL